MRILLASDHYPPFIGGAHRQTQLLAAGLAREGHDVTVVAPWAPGLARRDRDGGAEVRRVRQIRTILPGAGRSKHQRHQPPFPDPVTVVELRRIIAEKKPDVINVHGWLAFSVAAALGRRRIPLLVSSRDYGYFCAARTLVRKGAPCAGPGPVKCLNCAGDYYGRPKGWMTAVGVALSKPILARKLTGLHSISSYVAQVNRKFLLELDDEGEEGPVYETTIPSFLAAPAANGREAVDPEVEEWLAKLPKEPFILFVGAFRKIKGLETLFDAYGRLSDPPPLVLMGTYERDSPAEFPAEACILEKVPHAAVMAAWDRAMFGVMPSLLPEPLGGAVAEAVMRGKPVIGTQMGGHRDMIDSRSGILVPQGDAAALAAAMSELIDDPDRRQRLGAAAAARGRELVASVVLPRYEQAFRDVIERASERTARPRA